MFQINGNIDIGVGGVNAYGQPGHTAPEFQAIVQGLEVSSPSFHAILGVLFLWLWCIAGAKRLED